MASRVSCWLKSLVYIRWLGCLVTLPDRVFACGFPVLQLGVPPPGVVVRERELALVLSVVGRLSHPVVWLSLPAGRYRISVLGHGRVSRLSVAFLSVGDSVIFGALLGPYPELLLIYFLRCWGLLFL